MSTAHSETPQAITNSTLRIGDPFSHSSSPSSLQFERLRQIDIDWLDMIDRDVSKSIRAFSPSAGQVPLGTLDHLAEFWKRSGVDLKAPLNPSPDGPWNFDDIYLDESRKEQAVYFVLKTQSGNRYYVPLKPDAGVFNQNELPTPVLFDSLLTFFEKNAAAWQIAGLTAAAAKDAAQQIQVLDLATRDLLERYRRADEIEQLYSALLAKKPTIDEALWSNDAKLADLRQKIVQFSGQLGLARAEKLRISSEAKERGYVLPLEDISVVRPDDTSKTETYLKGKLYLERVTTVTWEVTESRTVYQYEQGACGGSATPVQVPVKMVKSASMPVYEEVGLANDPVVLARKTLSKEGFFTYEATHEERGWTLSDGTPLELLTARCARDESVRAKCAVILHFETTKALGLFPEHTALVVKRPLPGVSPIAFPTVSLREILTYNVLWTGTELGPLVGSINLAPGEERTITTSRTFTEELTVASSRKSLLEESSASSQDFATQLEREFNNETSRSSTSSTNLGIAGPLGPLSGNLGVSNSSTTSIKSAAKELNRIARKTAQSFNRKVQAETSVSATSKTTVQQSDSSTASVKNTNPGRTLNLLIHQINNRFSGGVFLNDIRVTVTSSIELIANTGIFSKRTVRLHELERVIDWLKPSMLPITIDDKVNADPVESYWKKLIAAFLNTLHDEYGDESFGSVKPVTKNSDGPAMYDRTAGVLSIDGTKSLAGLLGDKKRVGDFVTKQADPTDLLKELQALLQAVIIQNKPIVSETLSVASGSFYLDGQLGVATLLEPYAENMRHTESAKARAEVALLRLRAAKLASDENYIFHAVADGKSLTLHLRVGVASNRKLRVYYAEEEIGKVAATPQVTVYFVPWDRQVEQDDLARNLYLYDEAGENFMVCLLALP